MPSTKSPRSERNQFSALRVDSRPNKAESRLQLQHLVKKTMHDIHDAGIECRALWIDSIRRIASHDGHRGADSALALTAGCRLLCYGFVYDDRAVVTEMLPIVIEHITRILVDSTRPPR